MYGSATRQEFVVVAETGPDPNAADRVPFDYKSDAPSLDASSVVTTLAVLGGSTTAVSVMNGLPWMDVATSMQGGLGTAVGYGLGEFVKPTLSATGLHVDFSEYAPIAGAFIVPFFVSGGVVDMSSALLLAGAVVSAQISK